MKKRRYLRLVALLVCCVFLLHACDTKNSEKAAPKLEEVVPEHATVNYEDMQYERPDLDAINTHLDNALELVKENKKEKELFELFDTIMDEFSYINTMSSLASLKNNMNLSDTYYEEEATLLENEYVKLDNRMNDVVEAILNSSYKNAFEKKVGADFIERYEIYSKLNSKEIESLCDEETKLVNEYKKLLSKKYTSTYKGEEVSIEDLDFNDPGVVVPYYDIYKKKNKECAEIYKKLVDVRVQIANKLGYDNYTDYAYAVLGRDFTKEEASNFSQMVIENLVPLYKDLSSKYANDIIQVSSNQTVGINDAIPFLETALKKEFPEAMQEALQYMLDHNLYLFDNNENMMQSAYTTIINDYAAPFLFINTSVYTDPSSVFHEFGHYYNFYLMGKTQWNDSNNLDIAEIHSQGLELLMFDYYKDIYGADAEKMQITVILNMLNSILLGCCEDEFQQEVFKNPGMSVEEMNQLHGNIYAKYMGFPATYEWVDIHHHFETPFYYISYATSAASSLEIWELANQDRQKALSSYRLITHNTINCKYLTALSEAGLSSPFTSDMIKDIAKAIRTKYL